MEIVIPQIGNFSEIYNSYVVAMFIQLHLFETMYSRKRKTMRQIGKLWERFLTPGRTNDPQSWRFQLYQSHATDIARLGWQLC